MRRPPWPQYDDVDDVEKHRDEDGGEDDNDYWGAVETNARESDGDDKIKGANIEETDDIKES